MSTYSTGARGVLLEQQPAPDRWAEIQKGWDAFMQLIELDTPPLLTDGDTVERLDPEWRLAAERFIAAKRLADGATTELEAAKKALIALTTHPSERGAGVCVSRFWKTGGIEYKRIPELADFDLEPFRGPGREEVRVTVLK